MKKPFIILIGLLSMIILVCVCSGKSGLGYQKISIGLDKAQFISDEKSYYLSYTIVTKDSNIGGFGEVVEILISNVNGNLVISDWYIRYGTGSSSFDEKFRPDEFIRSPKIWDNQEYVKKVFEKAGIS